MKIPLLILLAISCVGMIFLFQFGFIFLALAMAPSIVAYAIDTDPKKSSFKVVLAGNLSAAMPTILTMLKISMSSMRRHEMVTIFRDPSVWMFVYLGAAAGWCLLYLCRHFARILTTMTFEHKIKDLQNEQKGLVEEWGQNIMGPQGTVQSLSKS
jgi:hypothetical protein